MVDKHEIFIVGGESKIVDFSTEEQYDLLLARETDDTKDNFGQLTHSIWSKP